MAKIKQNNTPKKDTEKSKETKKTTKVKETTKVEEPSKVEEPAKVEEPVKVEEPAKIKEPAKIEIKEPTKAEIAQKSKELKQAEKEEKAKATADAKKAEELRKEQERLSKKQLKKQKRTYANVLSTGSFVRAFILMLIPGVNIICVLLWALGAAKNRNKVHFSRACIVLFLIEILITAILLGAGYIYLDRKEAAVLKYADNYTNGLLTYFEIDSYDDLKKLKNIPDYLIDKKAQEEKPTTIPKTRYVINPEEITSYSQFMKLYEAQKALNEKAISEDVTKQLAGSETATESTTDKSTETTTVSQEPVVTKTLNEILTDHNVDVTKSGLVYIVIEKENAIIAFDPTGTIQAIPSISINNEIIYVGGAK